MNSQPLTKHIIVNGVRAEQRMETTENKTNQIISKLIINNVACASCTQENDGQYANSATTIFHGVSLQPRVLFNNNNWASHYAVPNAVLSKWKCKYLQIVHVHLGNGIPFTPFDLAIETFHHFTAFDVFELFYAQHSPRESLWARCTTWLNECLAVFILCKVICALVFQHFNHGERFQWEIFDWIGSRSSFWLWEIDKNLR